MKFKKPPVLLAVEAACGQLKVWCPFCDKWHYHGYPEGHRVAHCGDVESPYCKTGYYIYKAPEEGQAAILNEGVPASE